MRCDTMVSYLIKFFVLIRGARTPPPRMEAPVMNMPLRRNMRQRRHSSSNVTDTYHPAPNTLSPIHNPIPVDAQAYGLVSSRNWPTLNASPEPIQSDNVSGRDQIRLHGSGLASEQQIEGNDYSNEGGESIGVI